VATIGPASDSPEQLAALVAAGVDVFRINLSHGEQAHHCAMVQRIRSIDTDRAVAVLADLCGPKIRTGKLRGGGPLALKEGDTVKLVARAVEGTLDGISVGYPKIADEVAPGDRVLIDDGLIELRVRGLVAGDVECIVVHGGQLHERKGVNFPGAKLSIPALTDKDIADLDAVLAEGVDYVALSFVRTADDCMQAREAILERGATAGLVAKIEKPEAVENLEDILRVVDGVMVARGDLGVEMSTEAVPLVQKQVIAAALANERFVITATQMLQSMVEHPRPTRAEASDVANAVLDGTDAVMLSNETAVGKYPIEAVGTLDRIARSAEAWLPKEFELERLRGVQTGSRGRALAEAALFAAEEMAAAALVVVTERGSMARHIAALRPTQRIIALTPNDATRRRLAAVWGVEALPLRFGSGSDAALVATDHVLVETGLVARGRDVIVIAGRIAGMPASSMVKVHRVGDLIG
jgi:pyruvate kinase